MRTVEQLAHSDRSGAVLPYLPEVSEILRGEWIFQEEHAVRLGRFAKLHGLVGGKAFVHVVQQFDFIAELAPANLEQLESAPELCSGIEERLVVQRLRPGCVAVLRTVTSVIRGRRKPGSVD